MLPKLSKEALCLDSSPIACTVRSKLDEVVSSSNANKLIKQRLCLLLATMAAADGADAGVELIQHAMRFAQPLSDTGHVSCTHACDESAFFEQCLYRA
jgi:hypothetical protein